MSINKTRTLAPATDPSVLPNDLCAAVRQDRMAADWNGHTINLSGHAWNLYPEVAMETYISPSNNDCGMVKTPFLLEGLRDLTIEGNGARLLVRGSPQAGRGRITIIDSPMVPLVIRNCENLTLRNFSVDWATPGTIQGTCIRATPGSFDVRLDTTQRAWCWNGQLYIEGEGWTWPVRRLLGADPVTGGILPDTGDNIGAGYDAVWNFEKLPDGVVRITGPIAAKPIVGCLILFWCSNHDTGARRAPGIFIENSKNIRIEDVTLHYTWAMGVIAQNCENLSFERFVVEPSGTRKFSLAADGTHFVNCRGVLEFTNCRIQNQFDDAINAHGFYYQIVRRLDARTLRIRTLHPQHQGVVAYRAGDTIRIGRQPYLEPVGEYILESIKPINSETQDFTFATPLPETVGAGDFLENITACPSISLRGCTFRWNRARGVLLNGNGPIVVENNYFENPGSAILIESSAVWGEAGPVSSVRIAGNTFTRCTHCHGWGDAVIKAVPDFREHAPSTLPPFHGSITLERNSYRECSGPAHKLASFASVSVDD